jgi:hypothetical protein
VAEVAEVILQTTLEAEAVALAESLMVMFLLSLLCPAQSVALAELLILEL